MSSSLDTAKAWLSAKDAPNYVPLALAVGGIIVGVILASYLASSERFDNRNLLVTNAGSLALNRTLGQVDDRPGFGGIGGAERFRGSGKTLKHGRSKFMNTRGAGPEFWNIGTTLGNYYAGVDLSDDMTGVTDDAATVASSASDQSAADAAASAAAAGAAAAGANTVVQQQAAAVAAQEYFLKRPRQESAQDRARRNTSAIEDGLASRVHLGL